MKKSIQKAESIHLASTHPSFDTRIFHKECKTLANAGYRVTLLVPHDGDEVVNGVRIRSVPKPKVGRERLSKTLGYLYRAALTEAPEAIYHFHDAELIFHMFLLKVRGRRVIYDAHEDTPKQVMYQHWIPRLLRHPVSLVMRLAEWLGGRWFDGIIAAEPGILKRFPAKRTVLVQNFPLLDELFSTVSMPYAERPLRITYVGGITRKRGVEEMLAAIDRLPATLRAELVLGGLFHPAALEDEVRQMPGSERTDIRGWLQREQVVEVLAETRVGIVTLHPTPKYLDSYPTKLFEYVSAGLPVIASDFPQWRRLVEEAQCGVLVDPLDPEAIAEAMQWMLEHPDEAAAMGARGREAVRDRYSWEQEAPKLLAFYEDLCET